MHVPPPPPPIAAASEAPARPGCVAYGLFVLALLWICTVAGIGTLGIVATNDILQISGVALPFWSNPATTLVQALLIALPVGLLFAFSPAAPFRNIYAAWLLASGLAVLYGLIGALPAAGDQLAALLQSLLGALFGLGLLLRKRQIRAEAAEPGSATISGLIFALLVLLPWLWFGAFGSPLDTLLALGAGAGIGLAAALLLVTALQPILADDHSHPAAVIGIGGLALSAALLIILAGAGFATNKLLLLASIPPLGFGAVALSRRGSGQPGNWRAAATLIGLAAGGVTALFDPEEITLILGGNDIPSRAAAAAGWGFLTALAISGAIWAFQGQMRHLPRRIAIGAAILALGLSGSIYAFAGNPGFYGEKLFVILREQADLEGAPAIADRDERLTFVYRELAEHALSTQAQLRADLDRFGVDYTSYYLVNALEVDGGPLLRWWLSSRPEVDRVLISPQLRPLSLAPPPEPGTAEAPSEPQWNITSIGAERVQRELGISGAGIVIGQSDSGVDVDHPALQASYRGAGGDNAYNWLDPWYDSPVPRDYGSHGTHTLGSIVGANGIGVAPGATWFACSNLARNLGNPAYYLDCMQFMLAPYAPGGDPLRDGRPELAAHVLNNSWGCPPIEGCDPTSLQAAVDALRSAGIFVVASAGNEGSACSSIDAPIALYDSVFTVGAIDSSGTVTDFSSRGPVTADGSNRTKPDIVAPGAAILSAQPGGTYGFADGTSMAGPHVAGVVALIWSANPNLIGAIDQTEAILRDTAAPYTGDPIVSCAGGEASNVYGYGVVDAYAAVRAALALR